MHTIVGSLMFALLLFQSTAASAMLTAPCNFAKSFSKTLKRFDLRSVHLPVPLTPAQMKNFGEAENEDLTIYCLVKSDEYLNSKYGLSVISGALPEFIPNGYDEDGRTAYHLAAMKSSYHFLTILTDSKDILHRPDANDCTPLMYAIRANDVYSVLIIMMRDNHDIDRYFEHATKENELLNGASEGIKKVVTWYQEGFRREKLIKRFRCYKNSLANDHRE